MVNPWRKHFNSTGAKIYDNGDGLFRQCLFERFVCVRTDRRGSQHLVILGHVDDQVRATLYTSLTLDAMFGWADLDAFPICRRLDRLLVFGHTRDDGPHLATLLDKGEKYSQRSFQVEEKDICAPSRQTSIERLVAVSSICTHSSLSHW